MRSHPFTFTLLLVLLFLIPSASAVYSNDFSCNCMNGFNLVNSWGAASGRAVTTASVSHGTVTNTATYLSTFPTNNYWSIVMNGSWSEEGAGGATGTMQEFRYEGNATTYKSIQMTYPSTSTNGVIQIVGEGAYSPVTVTGNVPIFINITNTGSNLVVNVYTYSTMTLLNTQTIAFTPYITTDRLVLVNTVQTTFYGTSTLVANFDNIYVSGAIPSRGTFMSWQYDAYTVGDSPQFSWGITDTDWNSHPLQIYVARLYKSGIMQDWGSFNWVCLCSSQLALAQSGSYAISADVPGTYQITLELLNPITGNTAVTDSSTSVHAQSSSYFTIPSTAFIKTNTTATYHIGIGGRTGAIDWYFLNNGIEERESGKILTGTDGTVNITFSRVGTYNVYLKSVTGIAETFQMHTVVTSFIPSTPTNNFSTSSITLIPINGSGGSFGNYHMNEVLFGNYSIKSSVFANEGTFFLDIFSNDAQAITTTYYGSGGTSIGYNDFGTFALVISNNANDVLKTHWIPGNNSVRLRIQYPNGTLATLAMDTFSLSKLTISGYGLDVTPLQVAINQPVTATATSPESNSSLVITGANGYSKTYALPAGTTTLSTSFNQPGIYGFNLYSSFGYLAMSTQVTVSTVVVTPTPSTPANTRTLDFISSGSFLALIIFVTIIGLGGALAGAVGFLVGTFASIPLLYLAGLIPLWLVFLDAGIVFFGLAIVIIHQLTKSS